ncbi:hypothetical protein BB559_000020 [Furculomyces boomerangus]|uniref:Large ribosomal subunit protein mL54 n=2 Tax=Harpellales TaxID=61421 RepID=A0A2T9Z4M3_9FUNG|nr:hypothetical protein BB559_000642 [Furculomyces boomerangus]PVV00225.1 hypothetical protein BB559_000020 [Furculomyces boomerangus]PWA03512.1 hypothetical protein BB558_000328 [Smittium angustum]PWA03732.1 hypothetical protein BB558_000109 [Smittium angustum]
MNSLYNRIPKLTLKSRLLISRLYSESAPGSNIPKVKSYVSKGVALKGINYKLNEDEILAKDDVEYPEWLWTLLDQPKDDVWRQLKAENKKGIKQSNFLKSKKK